MAEGLLDPRSATQFAYPGVAIRNTGFLGHLQTHAAALLSFALHCVQSTGTALMLFMPQDSFLHFAVVCHWSVAAHAAPQLRFNVQMPSLQPLMQCCPHCNTATSHRRSICSHWSSATHADAVNNHSFWPESLQTWLHGIVGHFVACVMHTQSCASCQCVHCWVIPPVLVAALYSRSRPALLVCKLLFEQAMCLLHVQHQ